MNQILYLLKIKKNDIFRTYNSQDFNIFHPGGTVEYFKYIKSKIREESLNSKKKKKNFLKIIFYSIFM